MYYIKGSMGVKQTIELSDQLGKGGQATVYRLTTPSSYCNDCIKIYHDVNKFESARIEFMIANPPQCSNIDSKQFRICWPKKVVYDVNNRAVGYIMPLAYDKSRDLKILDFYAAGKTIAEHQSYKNNHQWHGKFERYDKNGLINRMKMMHNWALAIYRIHSVGRYVIVDIKPENVLATADGRISIVDTDSFQITDSSGKLLFNGPAFTEDYLPKIGYVLKRNNSPFTVDCDLFAMAIVFYKILIGVHPYAGTIKKSPYAECNTIRESIENDLCAFGERRGSLRLPLNSPHTNLLNFPVSIQQLFCRAFASNSKMPSAKEWMTTLKSEIVATTSGKVDIVAAKRLSKATKPNVSPKNVVSSPSKTTSRSTPTSRSTVAANSSLNSSVKPAVNAFKNRRWGDLNSIVSGWGCDLSDNIEDYVERAASFTRIVVWLLFAAAAISTLISEGILSALGVIVVMVIVFFVVGEVGRWLVERVLFALLTAVRFVLYNVYSLVFTILVVVCAFEPWDGFNVDQNVIDKEVAHVVSSLPTTKYYSIAKNGLNVRESSDTSSKIVGVLSYGDEVDLYKIDGDIAQIIFNDTICYVNKNYIKLKE